MLNKKMRDITLSDLVNLNIYDDVNFDNYIELIKESKPGAKGKLLKLLDRGNQILKETFINQELERINHAYRRVNPEYNLITTDYFKNEIDNSLTIIASRTVEPGPETIQSKKQNWLFKGYMTFLEFQQLPRLYPIFKDKYNEYSRPDWQLEIDILGAIYQGHLLIDKDSITEWKNKGVLLEPWGFDKENKIICFRELLVRVFKEMKDKAKGIREKGKPENLHEARILKLDDEGKQLFSQVFY